ncbi:hypothetical protein DSC45_14900 [Streptomyces sp. YIM 130001]|uniref:hypothetical protein n=1 Tax=Streptomyces sp. YIM 130001 TaxID=2259644 RepID=UPI000E653C00|nr:hypothetical protein [Streptomyces sp. YIM 130001]RII17048.1 hypothetical protein DSC45_14900 [Streptomyces sp. YIM 130001]
MSRVSRAVAAVASVTVLALTAGGCVTVHGEREIVPSATKAEAARALEDFTAAYNKADKNFDPSLDAARVAGPLSAINQSGLKAKRASNPDGNPNHSPLELDDAKYVIPKQAGWPRWFVADTDSNRDKDDDPKQDTRWVLVFTRGSAEQLWEASYLTLLSPDEVPEFKKDSDGWAEPVPADDAKLAVRPDRLSRGYTDYLGKGGDTFAAGSHTTGWRDIRERNAKRPGLATQYIDQPATNGDFAPVGLRTEDGGALMFYASRHFERQTAARGMTLKLDPEVKALLTGEAKTSVTLERVSNQAARVPAKGADESAVEVLSRIQGLTGAKGE